MLVVLYWMPRLRFVGITFDSYVLLLFGMRFMTVRYSLGDPLPTPWLRRCCLAVGGGGCGVGRWGERGGMCGHQPSAPGTAVALIERGSNNGISKE